MTRQEIREEIRFMGLFVGHRILSIYVDEFVTITSVSENGFVYDNVFIIEDNKLEYIETIIL